MKQTFLAVLIGMSALGAADLWPDLQTSALAVADDPIEFCPDAWGSVDDPDDVVVSASLSPSEPDGAEAPFRVSTVHTSVLPYDPRRARGPPDPLLS